MSEVRPIRERELLIDDDTRNEFRRLIDPLISHALNARGYIEEHTPNGRIMLDGTFVQPSVAYLEQFGTSHFHSLRVQTMYDVYGEDRHLIKAQLDLGRIGGLGASQFIKNGDKYSIVAIKSGEQKLIREPKSVSELLSQDIIQDIQAYTPIGYSKSDQLVPVTTSIENLEELHSSQNIDRRAHFELFTSEDHGDIQMNVGESFELKEIKVGNQIRRQHANGKKMFQLIARQPLETFDGKIGSLITGTYYTSSRKDIEMKLTTEIKGDDFSNEDKRAYYADVIRNHQEIDARKFGRGIIKNLQKIIDTSSDVMRLG